MAKRKETTQKTRVKQKHGNRKARLFKLIIIAVILVGFAFAIKNIILLTYENKKLETEHQTLISEKEQLTEELKNVNDKDYIEEQARIQLRMIKPGEIIYILQEEKAEKEKEKDNEKDN